MDLLTRGIGVRNFLSFGSEGFYIDELSKINVIIGQNNTGKSNVVRFFLLLQKVLNGKDAFNNPQFRFWDGQEEIEILLGTKLSDYGFNENHHCLNQFSEERFYGNFVTLVCDARLDKINDVMSDNIDREYLEAAFASKGQQGKTSKQHIMNTVSSAPTIPKNALKSSMPQMEYVPQFRLFRKPEHGSTTSNEQGHVSGEDLARKLASMKHAAPSQLAERKKFSEIQESVRELLGFDELEIDFQDESYQIILVCDGLTRYLESFGSGVHQLIILCFAINLWEERFVFIEEPEVYLHPNLQRRFIEFLRKTSNRYLLSTHSNVFLDALKQEDSRVFHVDQIGKTSRMRRLATTVDAYDVLDDLGYHASDIMQSNGVIWVEGPTDRLLLLRWLSLLGDEFKEGVHFSIMFYGGSNISHLSINPDEVEKRLIPLLRINRNAVLMLDSDRKQKGANLSAPKRRLVRRFQNEARTGYSLVWRTKWREVENYITERALEAFCAEKYGKFKLKYDRYKTLDEMIKWGQKCSRKFNYSADKVKYIREIVPHISNEDLLDKEFRKDFMHLVETISIWNR